MSRWTHEQVAKLAPDASSLAAARRLAVPGPWSGTGATETLLWGRCQGSGRTPYQVSVDLTGPAFRCSCPSRKFPCKHALALLLLWSDGREAVPPSDDPAAEAQDWAAQRAGRVDPATPRPPRPADPAARAKRLEARMALMDDGVADLRRWLEDLLRAGAAAARQQPYSWWDASAARLVDAQLPGLAEQVRTLASDLRSRDDWADHLLTWAGRWWTATHAWTGRASLDVHQLADLRAFVGWPFPTDEIRSQDAHHDSWSVLGAHRSDDGRLQEQRTWLRSRSTGETVQVLDFAAGDAVLPVALVTGARVDATVSRYPGSALRRALLAEDVTPVGVADVPAGGDVDAALATAAEVWARNPWAARVPVVLDDVRLTVGHVVDAGDRALPLAPDVAPWTALALSGGEPVTVVAELDDRGLRPLSLALDDRLVAV